MEKDYNCLFALKYQNLIHRIVGGVREKAREIPAFRDSGNGCIRITIVPLSQLADAWLGGGLSEFGEHSEANVADVCEREYVYAIRPGGSHVIEWKDPQDNHTELVNCYAYSAMKTAFATWTRKFFAQYHEEELSSRKVAAECEREMQYFTEDNGWSKHKGAVHTTVMLDGEDFLRIYVCTSGAESRQDEACSLRGLFQVQEFFYGANEAIRLNYFPDGICNVTLDFRLSPDFVNIQET